MGAFSKHDIYKESKRMLLSLKEKGFNYVLLNGFRENTSYVLSLSDVYFHGWEKSSDGYSFIASFLQD